MLEHPRVSQSAPEHPQSVSKAFPERPQSVPEHHQNIPRGAGGSISNSLSTPFQFLFNSFAIPLGGRVWGRGREPKGCPFIITHHSHTSPSPPPPPPPSSKKIRGNHEGTPKKARPLGSEPKEDRLAILKQAWAIEGPIWARCDNLQKQSWTHLAITLGRLKVILDHLGAHLGKMRQPKEAILDPSWHHLGPS